MHTRYEFAACPACDSEQADEELATREEIRAEMEVLWEFHMHRLDPAIPKRFLTDRLVLSQDPPVRVGRCRDCHTLFRNPRERGQDLLALYAGEELEPSILQSLHEAQRTTYAAQARRLSMYAGHPGTVLEVGSYVGGFLAAARGTGWEAIGVDLNASAVAFATAQGFRIHLGELDAVPADVSADAIGIWNCFDQLPDPQRTLSDARDRLKPGGTIAIRVPNGAFYARMRPHLTGIGRSLAVRTLALNNLLGFPYRVGYTPESLCTLLDRTGFRQCRVVGDTLVPVADRWTRPWARLEEKGVKRVMKTILRGRLAPWIEVYARLA